MKRRRLEYMRRRSTGALCSSILFRALFCLCLLCSHLLCFCSLARTLLSFHMLLVCKLLIFSCSLATVSPLV